MARGRVHSGVAARRAPMESGSGPEGFESVLTQDELGTIQGVYFIPARYEIELADPGKRVDLPPTGCLGVYEEALKASFRFPLHPFVVQLLNIYLISPFQITPNSWRFVIGFLSLCFLRNVQPIVNMFRACYPFKSLSKDESWWYFTLRKDHRIVQGTLLSMSERRCSFLLIPLRVLGASKPFGITPFVR